jgi:FkbM family methyltransferase
MLKTLVKRTARRLGLDVRRYVPVNSPAAQLHAMLRAHGVNVVLDVGANVGQFGVLLRTEAGYRGRIVSFEPMRAAHAELSRTAAGDADWIVARRAAIGASSGTVQLNVSGNSVSSSILPMLDAHSQVAPQSRYQATEPVPLDTLDSLAAEYLDDRSVCFLKIDTQGYEAEVLKGAVATVSRAVGLQIELSLVPLYEGQKLMPELIRDLNARGFELWGLFPAFVDDSSGRLLQVDATFFRARKA